MANIYIQDETLAWVKQLCKADISKMYLSIMWTDTNLYPFMYGLSKTSVISIFLQQLFFFAF